MLVEAVIYVALAVLAAIAWYCAFSHYNRKRSREVLGWIEAAFAGHGGVVGVHWRSPGCFLAHLQLCPNSYFQQAAIEVALTPREIPFRWLASRLRRIPESLTFEADLELAPLHTLELHHHRWFGRTRRNLPATTTWNMQQVTPLVITTRKDWQREILMMTSALAASRDRQLLNVSFRRTSPHFTATVALSAIAPDVGSGNELFTVLEELAGGASASRF